MQMNTLTETPPLVDGWPIARAVLDLERYQVVIPECPYCTHEHVHGVDYEGNHPFKDGAVSKASHCPGVKPDRMDYWIIVDDIVTG